MKNDLYTKLVDFVNINRTFISESNESMPVLENLNLSLVKDEFISLVGPSGCGKTTFLRIAAGFDLEFQGIIKTPYELIKSEKLSGNKLLGKIGYIPQEPSLFPWLTIEKNIEYGLNIKKYSVKQKKRIVNDFLSLVDLTDYKNYYPKEISGGMKQKIIICRAMAVQPEFNIILMDEPFSALDSQARNRMQKDLLNIWEKKKMTLVYVTHNIDEAVFLSDRIAIMSEKPSKIKRIINIELKRPRDRTSIEFNNIRREVLKSLSNENFD